MAPSPVPRPGGLQSCSSPPQAAASPLLWTSCPKPTFFQEKSPFAFPCLFQLPHWGSRALPCPAPTSCCSTWRRLGGKAKSCRVKLLGGYGTVGREWAWGLLSASPTHPGSLASRSGWAGRPTQQWQGQWWERKGRSRRFPAAPRPLAGSNMFLCSAQAALRRQRGPSPACGAVSAQPGSSGRSRAGCR